MKYRSRIALSGAPSRSRATRSGLATKGRPSAIRSAPAARQRLGRPAHLPRAELAQHRVADEHARPGRSHRPEHLRVRVVVATPKLVADLSAERARIDRMIADLVRSRDTLDEVIDAAGRS
ncbi:MerR family transcriptional regulator [Streptomyces massasporeus]|uniref:MerR family transcriptional regulator n=1 Tax=Streptomyces massasporeus TaxID=67324 RepID=UPI00366141BF